MNRVVLKCPAKINLFLNIVGKDKDYHQIHTINQTISLYDILIICKKPAQKDINISCNNDLIPIDMSNSIYKASKIFFEYTKLNCGIDVKLEKNIPISSGLGGESTDAAGILIGLNELFNTKLSEEKLLELGFEVGCDVPFCVKGGVMETISYGEILKPYKKDYNYFLIVTPDFGNSTKEMFKKYDKLEKYIALPIIIGHNDFKYVSNENIKVIINSIYKTNAVYSFMTGSGSSVVGIYKTADLRNRAFSYLKSNLNKNYRIDCAESSSGIEIIFY